MDSIAHIEHQRIDSLASHISNLQIITLACFGSEHIGGFCAVAIAQLTLRLHHHLAIHDELDLCACSLDIELNLACLWSLY